jgi:cation diffusion facilitator family transporter
MTEGFASAGRDEADREKRSVALWSLAAAVLLTTTKTVIGLSTQSLGVLAEAAHSGLDLAAAAVTLWAVHISSRPADPDHTYGHGKFENLSALFETFLLLATCVWIIFEAVRRLWFAEPIHVEANVWAFLVVALSIAVDLSRSRALARAAQKHQSQALEADALHFSSDVWSSSVVLLGLCGVWAAGNWPKLAWLAEADSVAAFGVAAIVVWVSLRLGKKSVEDLLDTVPTHLRDEVWRAAQDVPGVLAVRQVRLRRSGPEMFADVSLSIDRAAALEKAHEIADLTEAAIRVVLPKADVLVHVEPVVSQSEDLLTTVRVTAARQGLGAHGIRIYPHRDLRSLELHLEVPESLSLEEAHRQVSQFERLLRGVVPSLGRIVSHIEPAGKSTAVRQAEPAGQSEVVAALDEFLRTTQAPIDPHDIIVQRVDDELAVSFHCTLAAEISIAAAHQVTEQLENHLRMRVPSLGRVVIHVEPAERP